MRYLRQVMKMLYSRSGLAQMVADELLDEETPGDDVQQLWRVLRAFKIVLLTEGGAPLLRPMAPSGGDDEAWLLVTDGGLRGNRGGIGMVLAKAGRVLEVRGQFNNNGAIGEIDVD